MEQAWATGDMQALAGDTQGGLLSDPELRAALQRAYPRDAATGYAPGELRGAFTVSHSRP